jgi:hypothetical protein
MKSLILSLALALGTLTAAAEAPKETVKVCVDVKDKAGQTVIDPKTKKPKQNCSSPQNSPKKSLDGEAFNLSTFKPVDHLP